MMGQQSRMWFLSAAAGLTVFIKSYSDMESAINRVQTLMTGDEIDRFGGRLEKLARTSAIAGVKFKEFGKSMFDSFSVLGVGVAGFENYQIALKLAQGGATTVEHAMPGLVSAYQMFEKPGGGRYSHAYLAEAMYTSQLYGKTDVRGISATIGQYGAPAQFAGMHPGDALGLFAAITQKAGSSFQAATQTSALLDTLIKGKGEHMPALMYAMGVSRPGVEGVREKGVIPILENMVQTFKERPNLLSAAIPEKRARRAMAGLLTGKGMEILRQTRGRIQTNFERGAAGDGLDVAAARTRATMEFKMGQIWGAMSLIFADVGKTMLPHVVAFQGWMENLVEVFSNMDNSKKEMIGFSVGIAAIVLAIGVVLFPIIALIAAIGAISAPMWAFLGGMAQLIIVFNLVDLAIEEWGDKFMHTMIKTFNKLGSWLDKVTAGKFGWEAASNPYAPLYSAKFGSDYQGPNPNMDYAKLAERLDIGLTVNDTAGMVKAAKVTDHKGPALRRGPYMVGGMAQ